MADIEKMKVLEQGEIRMKRVETVTLHPIQAQIATVNWQGDPYEGPYEVTPGETAQVLSAMDKHMQEDIVVLPIPADYGRLSWKGHILTVW